MTKKLENPWLQTEKIQGLIDGYEDERLRAFLALGVTTILTKRGLEGSTPCAPFDMVFFVEVLRSMFERRDVLENALSGDLKEQSWWDEDK